MMQKQSLADVLQNRCQACNFIKKRLQHRCFPMKFTKFLRTLFSVLKNTFTLVATSGSKQCKPVKTYTKSLCCRERNDIPKRYFSGQCFQIKSIHLRFSEHCWQCSILVKLQLQRCSIKKVLLNISQITGVFLCKFCKIFKNHRSPPVAASRKLKAEVVVWRCSVKKLFLETSLNSQENTCARASFYSIRPATLLKQSL